MSLPRAASRRSPPALWVLRALRRASLTLECRAERIEALSDSGRMMLVKGRVLNAVSAPDHAQGVDKTIRSGGLCPQHQRAPGTCWRIIRTPPVPWPHCMWSGNINNRQNHKRPAEHSAGRLCCYKIIPAWQCSARKPRPAARASQRDGQRKRDRRVHAVHPLPYGLGAVQGRCRRRKPAARSG